MNYHVFIVNENTFKYHLEYMFAGTGAGNKSVPFLSSFDATIHYKKEDFLVGMIADVSRIRVGDKIIFYLQANNGNPGMFYGVFRATSSGFFDENDDCNFLAVQLRKPLTFRIKIEPDTVFPCGVSEHDYLDSLQGINYPYQMCWSLIYRKLKGNRGCTMITDYEYEKLYEKLMSANQSPYPCNQKSFTFDSSSLKIVPTVLANTYSGRTSTIDISPRMLFKAKKQNAFEVHLQAYIVQNFDKPPLNNLLLNFPNHPCWIGNEVYCGFGMQRIDVMIIQESGNDVYIRIVELKCVEPYVDILNKQLPWYIKWVTDYVAPNYTNLSRFVHIIPCVLAATTSKQDFIKQCLSQNQRNVISPQVVVEPTEYVGFSINSIGISFQRIV